METQPDLIESHELPSEYTEDHLVAPVANSDIKWGENRSTSRREKDLGFAPRPLILCNLPLSKLKKEDGSLQTLWKRNNGTFSFEVVGHPDFGLPYGKDKYIIYWVITQVIRTRTKRIYIPSESAMLETLGIKGRGGNNYKTLRERLTRIFRSQMFFFSKDSEMKADFFTQHNILEKKSKGEKYIEISDELYNEVIKFAGAVPLDFAIIRKLDKDVEAVDFYVFLLWRAYRLMNSSDSIAAISYEDLKRHMGYRENTPVRQIKNRLKNKLLNIQKAFKEVYNYEGEMPCSFESKHLFVNEAKLLPSDPIEDITLLDNYINSLKPAAFRKKQLGLVNELRESGFSDDQIYYAIQRLTEEVPGVVNAISYLTKSPYMSLYAKELDKLKEGELVEEELCSLDSSFDYEEAMRVIPEADLNSFENNAIVSLDRDDRTFYIANIHNMDSVEEGSRDWNSDIMIRLRQLDEIVTKNIKIQMYSYLQKNN